MKYWFLLIAFLPACVQAQTGDAFRITGRLSTGATGKIYLSYKDTSDVTDSVDIKGGEFSFTGKVTGAVSAYLYRDSPGLFDSIIFRQDDRRTFYLQNETIRVDAKDSLKNARISSPLNDEYEAYLQTWKPQVDRLNALNVPSIHDLDKIRDSAARKAWLVNRQEKVEKMDTILAEIKIVLRGYIREHPDSYFSLTALSIIVGPRVDMNIGEADSLYHSISVRVRSTRLGRQLGGRFSKAHSLAIGGQAPVFEQKDTAGNMVSLGHFRGGYVLLDFWASWCTFCRLENPQLVRIYNTYKDKHFAIWGITLDVHGDRDAWLTAIHKDGLPWIQTGTPEAAENPVARLYGISSIPQNVLVGPDGRIVARNLTAEALDKKLRQLLN